MTFVPIDLAQALFSEKNEQGLKAKRVLAKPELNPRGQLDVDAFFPSRQLLQPLVGNHFLGHHLGVKPPEIFDQTLDIDCWTAHFTALS